MRLYDFLAATADINIFRLCGSKILIIKASILQNLTCLDMNLGSPDFMNTQGKDTCKVLSHVKDLFALWCVNQFLRLHLLMNHNRKTIAGSQMPSWNLLIFLRLTDIIYHLSVRLSCCGKFFKSTTKDNRLYCKIFQCLIHLFTIIDRCICDPASFDLPGLIRSNDLLCTIRIGNYHFRY